MKLDRLDHLEERPAEGACGLWFDPQVWTWPAMEPVAECFAAQEHCSLQGAGAGDSLVISLASTSPPQQPTTQPPTTGTPAE